MADANVSFDEDAGILRCRLHGFFSHADMDRYERALAAATQQARRRSPRLLMLFDSSDSVVQSPEIVMRMRAIGDAVRQPGDRLAVIVNSVLMKMQADRMLDPGQERAFLSLADGEAWLKS